MKVHYLALLLALIVVAGTLPFLPIYSHRDTQQVEPGSEDTDETIPYKDTDGDDLPDVWENRYGLDWRSAKNRDRDTDLDGYDADGNGNISLEERFTNYEEYIAGTNPSVPDTDDDGIPDGWEIHYGFDPLLDDSDDDPDNDDLVNLDEYKRDTSPLDPDSDDDGLKDGLEASIGTNPLSVDTEGDGMPDGWEYEHNLQPLGNDSHLDNDGDSFDANLNGTIDPHEVYSNLLEYTLGTSPDFNDTDKDGQLDGWDTDGDGMSDGWEYLFGLDPTASVDAFFDGDMDNLSNALEFKNTIDTDGRDWTDPTIPDTDEDGLLDGFEVQIALTDPTVVDTDGDLMPDGWEYKYDLNPSNASDSGADGDEDGFDANGNGSLEPWEMHGNLAEYLNGTSPEVRDLDEDGVSDGWDTDEDGIPDGWEIYYGFDPLNASDAELDEDLDGIDIDFDGIVDLNYTNLQEFLNGTDPLNNDTDGDMMHDGWEVHYGLDPLLNDSMEDLDNDTYDLNREGNITENERLTNIEEYEYGSSPASGDSDMDGIPDVWEVFFGFDPVKVDSHIDHDWDGYDFDGDGNISFNESYTNLEEFLNHTNPNRPDTDRDGIIDGWEVHYGFDPLKKKESKEDFDNDGFDFDRSGDIDDNEEFDNVEEYLEGTNIYDNDTDGDGMFDGWEVEYGLDPLFNDSHLDADVDGLTNLEEFINPGLDVDNWTTTDPTNPDTDGDGIPDGEESVPGADGYRTDPTAADSDNDTMDDGWEIEWGLDPTDPSDADIDTDEDGYDGDESGAVDPWEEYTNIMEYENGTSPRNSDTDGDDMGDGWETFHNMDPTDPSDGALDQDSDGYDFNGNGKVDEDERYTNRMEFLNGTHPDDPDTDDDGMGDGWEAHFGFDPLVNDSHIDNDPSSAVLKIRDGAQYDGVYTPHPSTVSGSIDSGDHTDVRIADEGGNASSHGSSYIHQMFTCRWNIPTDPEDNDAVNNLTYSVGFTINVKAGGTGGIAVRIYNRQTSTWEDVGNNSGTASYDGAYTSSMAWSNHTLSVNVNDYLDGDDDILVMLTAKQTDGALVTDHVGVTLDFIGDGLEAWEEFKHQVDPTDWDSDNDGLPDGIEG